LGATRVLDAEADNMTKCRRPRHRDN
jgi:hypothetical protein